ncbi:MAG: BatA domain-containing protein [Planctomycetota bacterium]
MNANHLAMMSFVAPWMAWGAAAAVGLPLLAHLLSKTRYREVIFPAARLVQQAVAATSRIETPRHRLLMLLRWLVLMLLVLAFMRPQWTPDAQGNDDERIALVLLIDASASMQRTADGATLYDRALRQAQQLLEQLDPERDVAAVIRVDDQPDSLLPEPTAQFSLLMDDLRDTEAGYTSTNWPGTISVIQRLVQDERRTLRLITLSDEQGERPAFGEVISERSSTRVNHFRIEGPTDNTAVRLVDVRPYPAIVGRPLTATVEVEHYGDAPATIGLRAQFDNANVTRGVSMMPSTTERIQLMLPEVSGDRELIRVTLTSGDVLAADDITGVVVPVQQITRSMIIHDADAASQALAKRVGTLLNPGEVQGVALPRVQTATVAEAQAALESADAAQLRTVVLINRAPLSDALSQLLEAYAQAGGGVIEFTLDDGVDPQRVTTAAAIDFELEPLRVFEGPARAGLAALPWPGVSNRVIDERATPILMDDLERVIVAEMPRSRGRLIAINALIKDEPGGLLAEPAFVVLFNELCKYASPGPALPDPARPGDLLPQRFLEARQMLTAEGADRDAMVFTAPGPYGAMDETGFVEEMIFAELDPSESDMRVSSPWSESELSDGGTGQAGGDNAPAVSALRAQPIELWPYVILGVLGLAVTESLLLWRFAGPREPLPQGGAA